MPFFTTKDGGPLVLEIPPAYEGSITGTIMNCWQEALEPEADGYSTVADELSAIHCDSDHSVQASVRNRLELAFIQLRMSVCCGRAWLADWESN
jgi:hypothetical protein